MECNEMERFINKKRLLDTFIELVKINSPPFGEKEIGEVLSDKLRRAGCVVDIQDYGPSFNIIARKKGRRRHSPPLLLCGHMDTIEPTEDIAFELENDVVRTMGSTVLGADDKSALAQIVEAVTVLEEREIPHGDIEVVFTSAEENGLIGGKNLDFLRLKSRHSLVLDTSGDIGRLVIASPAHHTYELRISGRSAHAGIEPEKGISSVKVAAEIISAVPDGRLDSETTANIGIVKGGTATNVVPRETVVNGEVRSHNRETLERIKGTIFDVARMTSHKYHAQVHISEQEEYESFKLEGSEPFLVFMEKVCSSCDIGPVRIMTGGGSDANILNHRGIKTINMSTGMRNVHSTEEYIDVRDLYKGCLVVVKAIMDFTEFP
jgi:tripeptide aminopeptidase